MCKRLYGLILLVLAFSCFADDAPISLQDWKAWVLHKHGPEISCPFRIDGKNFTHQCLWSDGLELDINQDRIRFKLSVSTAAKVWVQLPGSQRHWPSQVTVDGQEAAVTPYAVKGVKSVGGVKGVKGARAGEHPSIRLDPGEYQVSGIIPLSGPIPSLQIPPTIGLVSLTLSGRAVDTVDIDKNSVLWLQRKTGAGDEGDSSDDIQLRVFRKLTDGVPIMLETRLDLSVSGKAREISIGQLLPGNAVLTRFDSDLPARVEENGIMRVQVRAGKWKITSRARYVMPENTFGFDKQTDEWPAYEVWSFEAAPNIRGVKVSGADSVDPSQLWGPPQWRQLPTYRISSQDKLELEELYRGEANPPANTLTLDKQIWIDFDGEGATAKDEMEGTIARGWRMSATEDTLLGRASVNGIPQVITQLADGSIGVEIRDPNVRLEAVSRFTDPGNFSATGWAHDIDKLSTTLFLPPGWKLWHIAGPDSVNNTWLSRWDLWDIFICLLVVAVTANILGKAWAGLSIVLLLLIYHDASAPIFSCISLLFALAFLRLLSPQQSPQQMPQKSSQQSSQQLPQHRFRKIVLGFCYGLALLVIVSSLGFAVEAVRQSIFPQLEYRQEINRGYAFEARPSSYADLATESLNKMATATMDEAQAPKSARSTGAPIAHKVYQATPENIQTGPGVPTWQWHHANFSWSGPVTAEERVRLYLSPPTLTRFLRLLQVLLIGAFAARLLSTLWQLRAAGKPGGTPGPGTAAPAAAVLLLGLTLPFPANNSYAASAANAESAFPPTEILEEYERRLLENPDCGDVCYAINSVQIHASDKTIDIRLGVSTLDTIGVPLPGFPGNWRPDKVSVGDQAATKIAQHQGQWYLLLDKGVHDIRVHGKLLGEEFTLDFSQAHNIVVNAPGWEVSGLAGKRAQSKSVTLSRKLDTRRMDTLFPEPITPFVAVHRHFVLDQDWIVNTTVTRIAPHTGSINVDIPLLAGENIRVDGIDVKHGEVAVSLSEKQRQVKWRSVINAQDSYTIENRSGPELVEHWSIEASPRWHIASEGITRVKVPQQLSRLRWRPWPGEKVLIKATKPTPVKGATTTIEAVRWEFSPGDRASMASLSLTLRSSIGYDYEITAPAAAILEHLLIDGQERVLPNPDKKLSVPLRPGLQTVVLKWRLTEGISSISSTPEITLATPPSNIDLQITMPRDRWPIFVGGPMMGPAMLFWGVLLVMLFIAAALSIVIRRYQLSIPLNFWQWSLLILGMSTVNMVGSVWVFAWFFALEARGRCQLPTGRFAFNLMQVAIILLTIASAAALLTTIPESLLSYPDMQVRGNGSHNYLYRWYQDHTDGVLPTGWVISLPIWAYRAAMLIWSLWLAFALMRWSRWAWGKYGKQGLWMGKVNAD